MLTLMTMPNHFFLLTGGKIVEVRNLHSKPIAGFVMSIKPPNKIGFYN